MARYIKKGQKKTVSGRMMTVINVRFIHKGSQIRAFDTVLINGGNFLAREKKKKSQWNRRKMYLALNNQQRQGKKQDRDVHCIRAELRIKSKRIYFVQRLIDESIFPPARQDALNKSGY